MEVELEWPERSEVLGPSPNVLHKIYRVTLRVEVAATSSTEAEQLGVLLKDTLGQHRAALLVWVDSVVEGRA